MSQARSTTRAPRADRALVAAADEARTALGDAVDAGQFGAHLGTVTEADRVVTHLFAATMPGYDGWRWAVTLARAPRQKVVTVNEVVLLPGSDALVAPEWLPWKDRVAPGDLGPGDLVPVSADDSRLVPGYLVGEEALDQSTAREVREVVDEVGLERSQVLSVAGRDQAAQRWYDGSNGPDDPIAQAAPGSCGSCGFLVRMSGPLSAMFGVCANTASPSDGQAVSFDHGCGAHSDVQAEQVGQGSPGSDPEPVHDTVTWDTWGDGDLELI
ncbi:MAG: DUF3027 domain-containing protein [Nocardioidaceae bacterium]